MNVSYLQVHNKCINTLLFSGVQVLQMKNIHINEMSALIKMRRETGLFLKLCKLTKEMDEETI